MTTEPSSPKPPDRIGRYRILGPLGAGGMGTVWKALDDANQAVVALKLLGPEAVFFGPEGLERFRREATALSRLPHPNIVRVLDAGQADGFNYLALEMVEGGPLSACAFAEMPLARKIEVARDVARALAHAHANQVVHRDVKPANVLLRPGGSAVLTDFGLARDLARQTKLTQTVALLGTPAYMSPEQAEGVTRAIDARSDVYSLGVVLYEMISGRLPFPDADPEDLLARIRDDRPPALSAVAPGVPRDVEAVVARAMERHPQDRYADGTAMLEDLERLVAGASPRARLVGGAEAVWREVARRPWLLAAAGLALLLLGLAAFCGGGPSRLTPSKTHKEVTSQLDALLDREAAPLPPEAQRLDTPRLTAALEELATMEPGADSVQVMQDVETEIDASRVEAHAVCVVDSRGDPVASRGDGVAAEALRSVWKASGTSARFVALTTRPWIGVAVPLHYPGEARRPGGWAIAGRPLDTEAIDELAADHEATIVWRIQDATWRSGASGRGAEEGSPLDSIGERPIPGGTEAVRHRGVLTSPARLAALGVAALGVIVLVAGLRRRALRRPGP